MANEPVVTIKGDILTIQVDLSKKQGKTKSGKSIQIASIPKMPLAGHQNVFLGLNVYQVK